MGINLKTVTTFATIGALGGIGSTMTNLTADSKKLDEAPLAKMIAGFSAVGVAAGAIALSIKHGPQLATSLGTGAAAAGAFLGAVAITTYPAWVLGGD